MTFARAELFAINTDMLTGWSAITICANAGLPRSSEESYFSQPEGHLCHPTPTLISVCGHLGERTAPTHRVVLFMVRRRTRSTHNAFFPAGRGGKHNPGVLTVSILGRLNVGCRIVHPVASGHRDVRDTIGTSSVQPPAAY